MRFRPFCFSPGFLRGNPGVQADQLAAQLHLVAEVAQVLLQLRAGDAVDVGQDVVEGAVFLQQLGGRLQADAGEYKDLSTRIDRLTRVQAGG